MEGKTKLVLSQTEMKKKFCYWLNWCFFHKTFFLKYGLIKLQFFKLDKNLQTWKLKASSANISLIVA